MIKQRVVEFNNEESRALRDILHKSEEPRKPFNTVKKCTTDITNNLYFRIGKHLDYFNQNELLIHII